MEEYDILRDNIANGTVPNAAHVNGYMHMGYGTTLKMARANARAYYIQSYPYLYRPSDDNYSSMYPFVAGNIYK